MILREAKAGDYGKIKALFLSAFPKEERPPYFFLMNRVKRKKARMLIAEDEGAFVGFAYLLCLRDMVYIFLLAVSEASRGKGYGSLILQRILAEHNGKRVFLAREQLDASADNYSQRLNRRAFYMKNGFEDLPCKIKEASVVYDVMGKGGSIGAGEYKELIAMWAGPVVSRLVDMRITEDAD